MKSWSFILIAVLAATVSLGAQVNSGHPKTPAVGSGAKVSGANATANLSGAAFAGVPPFVVPLGYNSGGVGISAAVGDLNGDGKVDFAVANVCTFNLKGACPNLGSVGVLISNGDGTFKPTVVYPEPLVPTALALADVNRDGHLDIVVVGQGQLGVMLGNGDGTFQAVVSYPAQPGVSLGIAVGDLNGDGAPDVAVTEAFLPNNAADTVSIFLNRGDGTFQPVVNYLSGAFVPVSVAIGDIGGNSTPDIVVGNSCGLLGCLTTGAIGALFNNGDGTFQGARLFDPRGESPGGVALADLNGDGALDIVAANAVCTTSTTSCPANHGSVAVLLSNGPGKGTFAPAVTYLTDPGLAGGTVGLVVTDMNGDGKLDLVVSGESSGVLLGNGDGTFQPYVAVTPQSSPSDRSLAVADLNGDGLPDLIVAGGPSPLPGAVVIVFNNAGAHTPTMTSLVSGSNPANPGQKFTLTAKVTSASAGPILGTVTFEDSGARLVTVQLNSAATASFTLAEPIGTYNLTAVYSGGPHTAASTSPIVVERIASLSKIALKTSQSPSFVGQSVTFTVTVTNTHGTIPDGELVTFYDNGVAIGTGATVSGVATFTTSALTAKTHTIKATYPGDSAIRASSATIPQVVRFYATTTTLVSSANPSLHGKPVTFTATVAGSGPAAPTGAVQFMSGANRIGSPVALSGATAKLTTSTLLAGTHAITAQYLGDSVSEKSTSGPVNQVVQ